MLLKLSLLKNERKFAMKRIRNIEVPTENSYFEVFPDEETFQKIFSECLENNSAPTSQAIESSYREMNDLFVKYLEAIQENMFRYAYQCGFNAALKVCRESET